MSAATNQENEQPADVRRRSPISAIFVMNETVELKLNPDPAEAPVALIDMNCYLGAGLSRPLADGSLGGQRG